MKLKYGCNPDQESTLSFDTKQPFEILHGEPGYINILDAIYSYSLVMEVKNNLQQICAASYKHTSPAGVSIGYSSYDAYNKARNCDPKSSFGDFIAINHEVDEKLALYIKTCVSDGIIAPSYTKDALEILKKKKQNKFLIFQGFDDIILEYAEEVRCFGNVKLTQTISLTKIDNHLLKNIVSNKKILFEDSRLDLLLSVITLKYTQSNSTCFTYKGQVIGIGAGQQSRIDCVRMARQKAEIWFLRQKTNLKFLENIKRQERINATISYLQDDFSPIEYKRWCKLFTEVPKPLTPNEKHIILDQFHGIVLGSDGFFPFRDSIDQASKINVEYVIQPGGSRADDSVIEAINEYNMLMVFTNLRLFLH